MLRGWLHTHTHTMFSTYRMVYSMHSIILQRGFLGKICCQSWKLLGISEFHIPVTVRADAISVVFNTSTHIFLCA